MRNIKLMRTWTSRMLRCLATTLSASTDMVQNVTACGVIHPLYATSLSPGVSTCSSMALDVARHWEAICIDRREKFSVSMDPLYMERNPGRELAVLLAVRRGDHAHEAFGRWAGGRVAFRGVHESSDVTWLQSGSKAPKSFS
jgi:hypothetical protein